MPSTSTFHMTNITFRQRTCTPGSQGQNIKYKGRVPKATAFLISRSHRTQGAALVSPCKPHARLGESGPSRRTDRASRGCSSLARQSSTETPPLRPASTGVDHTGSKIYSNAFFSHIHVHSKQWVCFVRPGIRAPETHSKRWGSMPPGVGAIRTTSPKSRILKNYMQRVGATLHSELSSKPLRTGIVGWNLSDPSPCASSVSI